MCKTERNFLFCPVFIGIKVGTSAEHLSESVEISIGKTFLLQDFMDIHQSKPVKRI